MRKKVNRKIRNRQTARRLNIDQRQAYDIARSLAYVFGALFNAARQAGPAERTEDAEFEIVNPKLLPESKKEFE